MSPTITLDERKMFATISGYWPIFVSAMIFDLSLTITLMYEINMCCCQNYLAREMYVGNRHSSLYMIG